MYEHENCIYFHFFDRELRNSLNIGHSFSDSSATDVIATALLMTGLPLYVSFSHMYESLDEFPKTISSLFECEKLGIVKMLTNSRSADEFISSRQQLYKFDENRYYHYFYPSKSMWPTDLFILSDDTTEILRRSVRNNLLENLNIEDETKDLIQTKLLRNKVDAITFPFFKTIIEKQYKNLELSNVDFQKYSSILKQAISSEYSKRYISIPAFNGTIVTGIPAFSAFDFLAKDILASNYKLYSLLLSLIKKDSKNFFIDCLHLRLDWNNFAIFRLATNSIVAALHFLYGNDSQIVNKSCLLVSALMNKNITTKNDVLYCILALNSSIITLAEKGGYIRMEKKVLVAVATPIELSVAMDILGKLGTFIDVSIGRQMGLVCHLMNYSVYLVKCQPGGGGVGGSALTLFEAVTNLNPDFVIMGGIAFGSDVHKQAIGDVLISSQVWEYDFEKLTESESIPRGAKYPASAYLLQMFDIAQARQNIAVTNENSL